MAYTTIPVGTPFTMVQNRSYAMPSKRVLTSSSGTIEVSLDETNWTAFTGQDKGETGYPFIRSTGANTIIFLK